MVRVGIIIKNANYKNTIASGNRNNTCGQNQMTYCSDGLFSKGHKSENDL